MCYAYNHCYFHTHRASNSLTYSQQYGISTQCTMICRVTPSGSATCGGPFANEMYSVIAATAVTASAAAAIAAATSKQMTEAATASHTHSSAAVNVMFAVIIAVVLSVVLGISVALFILCKTQLLRLFKNMSNNAAMNTAYDTNTFAAADSVGHSEESGRGNWTGSNFKVFSSKDNNTNTNSYTNRGTAKLSTATTTVGVPLVKHKNNDPDRHHIDQSMYDDGGYDTDTDSANNIDMQDSQLFLTGDSYNTTLLDDDEDDGVLSAANIASVGTSRLGLSSRSAKFGQTPQFIDNVGTGPASDVTGGGVSAGGQISVTEAINKKMKGGSKKDE